LYVCIYLKLPETKMKRYFLKGTDNSIIAKRMMLLKKIVKHTALGIVSVPFFYYCI
jgi:hypothetical protein